MISLYLAVKHLHIASVALSITLFMARAGWMLYSPERLQRRWVKVFPHVIDTVLLLSGAWLAWQLGAVGVRGWLPAKLVALLLYIALGAVALRYGRTRGARTAAMIGAWVTFAYIVSVALTKSPLGALVAVRWIFPLTCTEHRSSWNYRELLNHRPAARVPVSRSAARRTCCT